MGRNSGFIAMHSALSSCVADLCLVPEVDFSLDGPGGIVEHLYERLVENDKAGKSSHCCFFLHHSIQTHTLTASLTVVVIAEGAGQNLMPPGEEVKDASGNVLLEDVGPWLCKQLKKRLDDRLKQSSVYGDGLTLKYIDPSYMVRGIPPNTADNLYCLQLAQNAVHGGKCFQGIIQKCCVVCASRVDLPSVSLISNGRIFKLYCGIYKHT